MTKNILNVAHAEEQAYAESARVLAYALHAITKAKSVTTVKTVIARFATVTVRASAAKDGDRPTDVDDTTAEKKIPCEVYSRVVGYIRPTKHWNKGARQMWKERKFYKTEKDNPQTEDSHTSERETS